MKNLVILGVAAMLLTNTFNLRTKTRITTSNVLDYTCLLYTSPSPRDGSISRMPSSA